MAREKGIKSPTIPLEWPRPGASYKVKDGENWESVAKTLNVSIDALIRHNCGTREPEIVNWYLKNRVGCQRKTRDGWNYLFHWTASPGLVYKPITVLPEETITGEAWPEVEFRLVGRIITLGKKFISGGLLQARLLARFSDSDHIWGWGGFSSLMIGLEWSFSPVSVSVFESEWLSPVEYRDPDVDLREHWTKVHPWTDLHFTSVLGQYGAFHSSVRMVLKFALPHASGSFKNTGTGLRYHVAKSMALQGDTPIRLPDVGGYTTKSGNLVDFGIVKKDGAPRGKR